MGEKRCVTTPITAAEETTSTYDSFFFIISTLIVRTEQLIVAYTACNLYILYLHIYLHYTNFFQDAYTTLTCITYKTYITIQLH